MGIFNKKEKRDLQITISEGIRVGRPLVTGRQNALLSCIPKGILVYMVVFGSLGAFCPPLTWSAPTFFQESFC